MTRPAVVLLVTLFLHVGSVDAQGSPQAGALHAEALKLRERNEFARAADLLARAVRLAPSRLDYRLTLGETLSWLGQFREAEAVYREAVLRFPGSLDARLGLGQTLLWQEKYGEAERAYREALDKHPGSVAARVGAATASYWSGDFRRARKEYERVILMDPGNAASREALAEIAAATAPAFGLATGFRRDDQPYRMNLSEASLTLFSDEVTKWTVRGGSYALDNPDTSLDATSPFGELAGQTKISSWDFDVSARIRLLRFPDGHTGVLPALSIGRDFGRRGRLTVSYEENELLFSERSLESRPSFEALAARWSRENPSGWSAAASARALRYFDGNEGVAADAWTLLPLFDRGGLTVAAGPAISLRDTDESRFRAVPGSSRGVYDPYWTPQELIEGRGVVSATWRATGFEVHFHGDGGVARDEVIDLASGNRFSREFHPWSIALGGRKRFGSRLELSAEVRRESTVFYAADEIRAGIAGRF